MPIDVEDAYRRFGPMVRRRCERMLRDPELARDAMHDTFVRVVRRSDDLDDRALSSLLYRIATNVCLNRIRGWNRRPEDPEEALLDRIAHADDPGASAGARLLLDRLFAREPASTRTLAVLHLLDGMTLEEVAEHTGLSVSGVRYRLRALRAPLHEL
ncbi:MAG: sigma-70 family RNA polymerase sigma factor, partial [Myxococcales bacterium]|nr:sigma-70 family RNA polymerase sigma factor [Myxococcales bacterium]